MTLHSNFGVRDMENQDMQGWELLRNMMTTATDNMRPEDVPSVMFVGLPAVLLACNDGINETVKKDAKVLFIKMIDKLDILGVRLKPDSPVRMEYEQFKKETGQQVDEKVHSPLTLLLENLSMNDILNAPPLQQQPNK